MWRGVGFRQPCEQRFFFALTPELKVLPVSGCDGGISEVAQGPGFGCVFGHMKENRRVEEKEITQAAGMAHSCVLNGSEADGGRI